MTFSESCMSDAGVVVSLFPHLVPPLALSKEEEAYAPQRRYGLREFKHSSSLRGVVHLKPEAQKLERHVLKAQAAAEIVRFRHLSLINHALGPAGDAISCTPVFMGPTSDPPNARSVTENTDDHNDHTHLRPIVSTFQVDTPDSTTTASTRLSHVHDVGVGFLVYALCVTGCQLLEHRAVGALPHGCLPSVIGQLGLAPLMWGSDP
ncbi:hypothetical protein BXZ70DRAFT_911292 [Cristinia sonorae]|uniref:Uncharacterized protein n=1 Tax=Cristinia sonorae TaxID=1940300 RepID=A0A8K0XJX2_9AGAR|nr:hypothetical protein BXZ70DRAFT_911292 [Cristinia sonorae]